MSYVAFQNNPLNKSVGDCTVRAISLATNQSWDDVYWGLCEQGFEMGDMPSSNAVGGEYLKKLGFNRYAINSACPSCYKISDFAKDHPRGTFIVGTGTHLAAVINGTVYDAWDSSSEVPIYFYRKER